MIDWHLIVVALAAYRLTRIVTTDTLTENLRDRLYHWAWVDGEEIVGDDGRRYVQPTPRAGALRTYVNELLQCSWCLGVWVSAGVYAAWRWWEWEPVRVVIVIAAIAGAQGFLASRRDA